MTASFLKPCRGAFKVSGGRFLLLHYTPQRNCHLRHAQPLVDGKTKERRLVDSVGVAAAFPALLDESVLLQVADDLVDGALGEVGAAGDFAEGGLRVLEEVSEHETVVAEEVPLLGHDCFTPYAGREFPC